MHMIVQLPSYRYSIVVGDNMLPQNKNINLEIGQNFVEVCEGIDMAVIRKTGQNASI